MTGALVLSLLVQALASASSAAPAGPPPDVQAPTDAAYEPALEPAPRGTAASDDGQRQEDEPDRWAAVLDLGFASSSGNSELTSLTTGIKLRHLQTRVYKLEWSITFRYGESQGEVVARNLQSKLDFDMGPSAVIAPFVFASAERDPFRKLDLRARTGSGVKYTFYKESAGEGSLRLAAQYSRENFTVDQDPRTDGGWSVELKGNRRLGETLRIENATTFDPLFDDFSSYDIEAKSKLSSRISQRLALTLMHTYSFDSNPAPEVGRTDQRFQAGLTIDF
jgi:hypothetical protein